MNSVTTAFPNRKLHVILDNLNTHKKNEHWLKAHPNVQFHFTPTSASWLNQVEVWFSILQGQSLSGTSFTSLKQLQDLPTGELRRRTCSAADRYAHGSTGAAISR